MNRWSRSAVVFAVAVSVLLILEAIPGSNLAPSAEGAPAVAGPGKAVLHPVPAHVSQVYAHPASGASYRSLCLLAALARCGAPASAASPGPAVPLSGSVSSWTNLTPPSGKSNPSARLLPSMTYYPSGHETLLFGGLEPVSYTYDQDTWAFVHNNWTELVSNTSCTPSTCPSPRADAMVAYYAPRNAILLFGGEVSAIFATVAYGDTWMFYGGSWHNLTSGVGVGPSPRFGASMTWDSLDNRVVLFGGALASGGTVNDTWTFNGTWTNVTRAAVGPGGAYPVGRAGASISDSPSGYLLMFGGEHNGTLLTDVPPNCGSSTVAWWYHEGKWLPQLEVACINAPAIPSAPPSAQTPVAPPGLPPPCGRVYPALGWSPQNNRFVLYGGFGFTVQVAGTCGGTQGPLNDTWMYQNPSGNGFDWVSAGDSGDPSNRSYLGYASDFTDNYFIIFGGYGTSSAFNETWRFFEVVHAHLTGPSTLDTNASGPSFTLPFTVQGFGGSGTLVYDFSVAGLRNAHTLTDGGHSACGNLTSGALFGPLPYDGIGQVSCAPSSSSYNVYRLTVHVADQANVTDAASATWTFTVLPPETAVVYSEFAKYFYTGFTFDNQFSAFLKVDGQAPSDVSATLGGNPITLTPRSAGSSWWDSPQVNMGAVAPGATLRVTGDWSGWTLNATYAVQMVSTPSWLASLFKFTLASQKILPGGAGPYNRTYTIWENYSWNAASSSSFTIPTAMISGDYALIPAMEVSFSATSSGVLALGGSLSLTPPSVNLGIVSLKLTAAASLTGKFNVSGTSPSISTVQWQSAKATLGVSGDVGGSVPIYGFNILGIQVGFSLKIDLKPSVVLTFLLAPTTDTTKEIISGIEMMMVQLVGTIQLALSVAVVFGIGIASVGIGGQLSVALAMNLTPSFHVGAGWVNGSIFATASFLFWSDSWTLLGPAVIYSWTDPPPALPGAPLAASGSTYDNGTNSTWTVGSRYYAGSGYDVHVWDPSLTSGPAISDIYPHTQVAGAAGYNGGYLFYTRDDPSLPVDQGLTVAGARLDPSTNALTGLPSPNDPNFVIERPRATTLPDGSLYVVWAALPQSETTLASPTDLTRLDLQGARFYPGNSTWGPVTTWTNSGILEAYQVDGSRPGGSVVALVAPSFLVGPTTAERLVQIDLATGREVSNASVTGLSQILSVRSGLGEAVVQDVGGNFSVVNLSSAAVVPVPVSAGAGAHLIGESFALGSAATLLLLFRNPNASELVLVDARTGQAIANRTVDGSATDPTAVEANGTYYVFASEQAGIEGWRVAGETFYNLTLIPEANVQSFGLVQAGASLVVYALVSNGALTQPILSLDLTEVGATLPAVPTPVSASTSPSSSKGPGSSTYLLYLGIVALAEALLLGVWAVRGRRQAPPAGPTLPPSASPGAAPSPSVPPQGPSGPPDAPPPEG